jgi:SHS2 domain-containing protein
MSDFELFDHTADVGIVARGGDLKDAFATAAYAVFNLIADPGMVSEETSLDVEVEAPDRESLLVSWINELLYQSDVEQMLFKRFEINEIDERHLKAKVHGERIDPSRHGLKTQVKAATYHGLKIEEKGGMVEVRVILDI